MLGVEVLIGIIIRLILIRILIHEIKPTLRTSWVLGKITRILGKISLEIFGFTTLSGIGIFLLV